MAKTKRSSADWKSYVAEAIRLGRRVDSFVVTIRQRRDWPAMLVFFFTFPTGRFIPRWTWAAFVPFFAATMLSSLPVTAPLVPAGVLILTTLLPIVVQIYRYVRIYAAAPRSFLWGGEQIRRLLNSPGLRD